MNRNLWLLTICQGLFLTNNVTFIAINGLVGLALATSLVARAQRRFGRRRSFQIGIAVALGSALLCAQAAIWKDFWLLCSATVVAGYYNANASLYRFAAD